MVITHQARLTLPQRHIEWQKLADARLELFGTDALLVPMAWQTHDTGLVVTTIGGQQVDFTYSQSQRVWDFDTPPSYLGPTGIPIINFNQSDEWLETPDAAFWNDTAGSSEPSYYWSCWVFTVAGVAIHTLLSKSTSAGETGTDWMTIIQSNETYQCKIIDDSANAVIGSQSSALSDGWHYLAATKHDDSALSSSVITYVDGVADRSDFTEGTYVQQEDGTTVVRFGAESDGDSPLGLSVAGGPLGPMFIAVGANAVPTPDAILRDYQLGRAALGI